MAEEEKILELNPLEFWQYSKCNSTEINMNIFQNYKSKTTLNEDIKHFYIDLVGSAVHPSLVKAGLLEADKLDSIKEISFNNIKVDKNTIKILFSILPKLKVISLKFTNNQLDIDNLELILSNLFTTPNNIYSFSYEWNNKFFIGDKEESITIVNNPRAQENELENPVAEEEEKPNAFIQKLFNTNYGENQLEAVSLRGCHMGNEQAIKIFDSILENTMTNLVILNLFGNNLNNDCLEAFVKLLRGNQILEQINLGGNSFDDYTITVLKQNLGLVMLNENEVAEYLKKVKEKQEIEEWNKNKKNRNKQKPVPVLDIVNKDENNNYFRVRNTTIKRIDFMQNPITQKSFENILGILDQDKDLIFVFDLMIFDKESILKIRDINGPYISRIVLCK